MCDDVQFVAAARAAARRGNLDADKLLPGSAPSARPAS